MMTDDELDPTEEPTLDDEAIDLSEVYGDSRPAAEAEEAVDDKAEVIKAKARADAYAEENARLQDRLSQAPQPPAPAPTAAPPPSRRKSLADVVDDNFAAEFLNDAPGALRKVLSGVDEEVERRVAERIAPAGVSQGMAVVANFLRDKRDAEPEEYAIAVKAFNERVAWLKSNAPESFSVLVNQAPAQAEYQLNVEWDTAYAKGVRAQRESVRNARPRAAEPPNLSGSRGGGGAAPQRKAPSQLTAFEKQMVERAKAMGLSMNDAMDLVREDRAERRRGA